MDVQVHCNGDAWSVRIDFKYGRRRGPRRRYVSYRLNSSRPAITILYAFQRARWKVGRILSRKIHAYTFSTDRDRVWVSTRCKVGRCLSRNVNAYLSFGNWNRTCVSTCTGKIGQNSRKIEMHPRMHVLFLSFASLDSSTSHDQETNERRTNARSKNLRRSDVNRVHAIEEEFSSW